MASMTISVVKGVGSISHNNREFITQNVDEIRVCDNVTYKKETLKEAYQKLFGEEVERYNSTQKRSDRKIDNYMDHIRQSKNGEKLFYETVVQIGNKFDCSIGSRSGEIAKNILDEYMKGFEERNPNLYVFNAVLHLDESTPHLHIDYIPIAKEYKNGLQIRNSLDKALKQQGFDGVSSKKNNSTQAWQNNEVSEIEKIMKSHELDRKELNGMKRNHLTVDEYKAVVEITRNQVESLSRKIEIKKPLLNSDEYILIKKDDYEWLNKKGKLSKVQENSTKEILNILKEQEKRRNFNSLAEALENENQLNESRKKELENLKAQNKAISEELKEVRELNLTVKEISQIKPKLTLLESLRGITLQTVDILKKMALETAKWRDKALKLEKENKLLKKDLNSLTDEFEKLELDYKENNVTFLKVAEAKAKVHCLENAISMLPKEIQNFIHSKAYHSHSKSNDMER